MPNERAEKLKKILELVKSNTPEGRLKAITELLKILNEGISKKDFINSFKTVIDHVLNTEIKLIKKIDAKTEEEKQRLADLISEFNQIVWESKKLSESTFGGIRQRTLEMIDSLFARNDVNKRLQIELDKVTKKLASIRNGQDGLDGRDGVDGVDGKNGIDGKDADEEKIIKEVLSKIELPDIEPKLEELRKEMTEMIRRNKRVGGGGLSKIALESKFIDGEIPTGTINGVNLAFTIANIPNPPESVNVIVNGARMKPTEDYSILGNVITFVTAPPTNSDILLYYRT